MTTNRPARGFAGLLAVAMLFTAGYACAQQVARPAPGAPGQWRLIGQTHARHTADHDTIVVQGPYDNFRRIKFKVTDSPLRMHRVVVTYDNGATDSLDVRHHIPRGGETRAIDLRGAGKRSLRRIDFWYDTRGILNGQATVVVYGMK
ncbi:MAG: DUF2541 family protein [Burkholderiales bacterium]|nr:DUF2541 family protein [Burkholderiales bacterium]MCC7116798.1 DUF2541 family protein [Burkholderiales bacterium]